jgi:hypothetical protein
MLLSPQCMLHVPMTGSKNFGNVIIFLLETELFSCGDLPSASTTAFHICVPIDSLIDKSLLRVENRQQEAKSVMANHWKNSYFKLNCSLQVCLLTPEPVKLSHYCDKAMDWVMGE